MVFQIINPPIKQNKTKTKIAAQRTDYLAQIHS